MLSPVGYKFDSNAHSELTRRISHAKTQRRNERPLVTEGLSVAPLRFAREKLFRLGTASRVQCLPVKNLQYRSLIASASYIRSASILNRVLRSPSRHCNR